ncbi:MAG: hypothetical protein V9F03_01805 [Microthrixaceae bacterium]
MDLPGNDESGEDAPADPWGHSASDEESTGDATDAGDAWIFDEAFVDSALFSEGSAADRSNRFTYSGYSTSGYSAFDQAFPADAEDPDAIYRELSTRRKRRRRRAVRLLATVVAAATLAAYGLNYFAAGVQVRSWNDVMRAITGNEPPSNGPAGQAGDVAAPGGSDSDQPTIDRGDDWPPPPENPSTKRVLPAVTTLDVGAHAFIQSQRDGTGPVAYDPCRPIRFVVSGASDAPIEGSALISESIAEVAKATGLEFIDEGSTDERPSDDRKSFQPDRYGQRWAPVLIAWSNAVVSPRLAETSTDPTGALATDVLGYAGSSAVGLTSPSVSPDDGFIFVTGTVTLDGPDFASLLQTKQGYAMARAALMHELGHLVGLDHVDDPTTVDVQVAGTRCHGLRPPVIGRASPCSATDGACQRSEPAGSAIVHGLMTSCFMRGFRYRFPS